MPHDGAVMTTEKEPHAPDRDLTTIVFCIPPEFGGRYADVAGDFTAWASLAMEPRSTGGFCLSLRLERGFRWRYRFLVDGEHWMNDPNACELWTCPDDRAVSVLHT
jgi:Glycogen recognition site of AMP-activated protein kinase